MSKKNEIVKVPFYGDEIVVIEENGQRYVGMKPIVQGIGLDWDKQQELIKRDPVLSSVTTITGVTGKDGKTYQMICLPLEYLNGWLFKVPASRYKGWKREAIIRYQKKCYLALHDYFMHGAAVNSAISLEQTTAVLKRLLDKLDRKDDVIRELDRECRNQREIIDAVTSGAVYGDVSPVTGKRKLILVRQHFRSYAEPKVRKSRNCMQMMFDFFTGGK
ncbi:MAG: phage antirepressor N-terminal domain-containing protein [Victivallaceae bacterium]|nr:phage antirepressor N-terminal domain-containing protein [Victivallaceae bacterium]